MIALAVPAIAAAARPMSEAHVFGEGGTVPFTGHYYGDMILNGTPNATQIAWAEAYYNNLCAAF